ncbi:copper amine oxidase N-terminal domain-containing protein [Paenibacillus gallinarum]|uniref:Copper amine oxidase N-terminal domain-containing protein n=1 Tax=Paenibacillus gallinarum TaxID=2762232 RepID=A0ABR8SSG5_9BACL|nr:copper amine oxidase N-terminal domain-containing protein [Paenibacillus gallinarum]MBD7966445.1 copper amine oxidase N-terminal domain-containing protein [Paenibacillus gallinarum]
MKWKSFFLTCFAMFFIVSTAQAATSISVVVNDRPLETDVAPFIKNGTTFVPLRTIEQMEGISIKSWNNKTKTLVIVDPTKSMTFSVKQNQSESMLIKDNRVMVPIRFIAENFNSDVAWDANTKTVQVAKLNEETKANLNSDDVTTSRLAAITIPRITTLKELTGGQSSGGSFKLLFPEGESKAFFRIDNGIVEYFEVKGNAAWLTWSGKIGGNENKLWITNSGISSEVGQRPKVKDRMFFYYISTHAGQSQYGYLSNTGKETILGSKDMSKLEDLFPILEENEADQMKKAE